MANHLLFWGYGEATTNDPKNGGWQSFDYVSGVNISIPSAGTVFRAISPAQTLGNGAVCNAIVEVLPTGLNVHSKKYLTDSTVTTLNTGAA